jgi:hypothetical protein
MSEEKNWQEPTPEQIKEWKKEHDEVFLLKAKDPKDGKVKPAYVRSPTVADLQRAAASDKQKAGTYNQSLYENCVLDAHPDVKKSKGCYQGMIFNMDKIIVAAEVEVEKL